MMRDDGLEQIVPEVMFLPLAVADTDGFGELDPGVLARRFPDFVHQVLNQGQYGPTGMLEVQSPPEEGPVSWVVMDATASPEDAWDLVPDDDELRALVTGELAPSPGAVRVEFHVYFAEDDEAGFTNKIGGLVSLTDPIPGLLQLARRLARVLELPYHEPPKNLLTGNGKAFWHFLLGLDSAMLLSGDLQIAANATPAELMRPFAKALALDAGFGLALRVAHSTMTMALQEARLDKADCQQFLDDCYAVQPHDGEGCVAVAEQLSAMGDQQRAIAWLQHATHLDPPPPRGLENLGILFARRGETVRARDLWLRGVALDGHPDFFAHLARLYFAEHAPLDAWDMVLRGLRRLHERSARSGEWEDHERGAGVLLEYLHEHLADHDAPADLIEALLDLRGLLDGNDQIALGLCLAAVDRGTAARLELQAGLEHEDVDLESRDQAVRALLVLQLPNFERRFSKAVDTATNGRNPRACLGEFQAFLDLQSEFWPALFYCATAKRQLGERDEALDLLAAALKISPGQPDALRDMAQLFAHRGNHKRALELIDEALLARADDPRLLAAKIEFLLGLGRRDAARECLDAALRLAADDRELLRLKQQLR